MQCTKLYIQSICQLALLWVAWTVPVLAASPQAEFNSAYKSYMAEIEQQDFNAALPFAQKSYELSQKIFEPTDPSRLAITDNYGVNLMMLEQNAKAASIFSELLTLSEQTYGRHARELQPILDDLVEVSKKLEAPDEARLKELEVRRYKLYLRHNSREFIEQFKQGELATTQHTKNTLAKLNRFFDEEFQIYETDHWSIIYHPKHRKGVKKIAKAMEHTYESALSYLVALGLRNKPLETKQTTVYFPSKEHYARYMTKLTKDKYGANHSGGFYSPKARAAFFFDRGKNKSGKSLYASPRTVVHETAHQVFYAFGLHTTRYIQPRWLKEGVAVSFEPQSVKKGKYGPHTDNYSLMRMKVIHKLIKDDELISLSRLISFDGDDEKFSNASNQSAIYALGGLAVRFFYLYYPDEFKAYLAELAKESGQGVAWGKKLRRRQFSKAFGQPESLDEEFETFVMQMTQDARQRVAQLKRERKQKATAEAAEKAKLDKEADALIAQLEANLEKQEQEE